MHVYNPDIDSQKKKKVKVSYVKSKHFEKGRPSACNKYGYNKTYSHRPYKFWSSDMVC